MATPRNRKRSEPASPLADALKFISVAQQETGTPYQTHSILENGFALAFNGVITAGMAIAENVTFCPHSARFNDALARAGQSYVITQLDAESVAIKAGPFRAVVPCLPRASLPACIPDAPIAPLDDRLLQALAVVSGLCSGDPAHIATAAILLRAGSAIATDRFLALEYWHGLDLPCMRLPKATATALCKAGKPLARLGYSGNSATFYFSDGSWLKSQLYSESYPNIDMVLNVKSNPWPVPQNFFEGVRSIAPFNDGNVVFGQNVLRSHYEDNVGASYEVSGIPKGLRFNAKHLLAVEHYAKQIDFAGVCDVTYFFGDNVRGCLTQLRAPTPTNYDADIPF